MAQLSGRRRFVILALPVLLAAGLLLKREVQIVPEWRVRVLDDSERPVAGLEIRESWEYFGSPSRKSGNATLITNEKGEVVFPTQSFRASIIGLWLGRAMTLLNVHGSFGSSGTVSILPKGLKPSSAYYSGAGKVHDQTGAVTVRQQEGITTTFRLQERDVFDFAMDHEWDKVRQLLARDGATVIKSRNRNGATLLIALSENDYAGANAEIIGLLLASGADINAQAKDGTTALHNAAKGHRVDYLGFLLSKGADPRLVIHDSYYPTTNGFTPLHFLLSAYDLNRTPASSAQKIQAIKLLLKHGADVNAKDAKGDSPLHHAAVFGDPEIVSALLRAGADRSARNSANETALTSIRRLDDTPAVHRIRDMLAGK